MGDGRYEELFCRYIGDPVQNGALQMRAAQLGDYVGVQEVHRPISWPKAAGGDAVGAAA